MSQTLSEAALEVVRTLRLAPHAKGVCAKITVKGSGPNGLLARPLYEEVNKVLTALGGKWDRKAAGHIFPDAEDVDSALDNVIHTGVIVDKKKLLQFYETPDYLADQLVRAARIETGMRILEPSAGHGALLRAVERLALSSSHVEWFEIDEAKAQKLKVLGYWGSSSHTGYCRDFLEVCAEDVSRLYDRVVMNPPFTKQQDAKHVRHAYSLLKPNGCLAAIMSAAVEYRDTPHYEWVRQTARQSGGSIRRNPEGSFKASGTNVATCTVVLNRLPTK